MAEATSTQEPISTTLGAAAGTAAIVVNTTNDLCTPEVLEFEPSVVEFLNALGVWGWVMLCLATIAFVILVVLFTDTVIHVVRYTQVPVKETTAIVLTVYPVLGLCSYLGLMFQKANIFLDAAAQLWFAFCMYQFLTLTLKYFGGESSFVDKMQGTVLPWKGPPCCCFPCCVCPKSVVNKRQIRVVKILVMQHPWLQLVLSIIMLTLWLEGWYTHGKLEPTNTYLYIVILSVVSFLFGLWAFIVGFKASLPQLQEFHYTPKIIAFQLCLVFLRLQALIVNVILVPSGAIPCLPPISPRVFANTILNSLLLGQLVVLMVVARHYYKLPIPKVTIYRQQDTKDMNGQSSGMLMVNGTPKLPRFQSEMGSREGPEGRGLLEDFTQPEITVLKSSVDKQ